MIVALSQKEDKLKCSKKEKIEHFYIVLFKQHFYILLFTYLKKFKACLVTNSVQGFQISKEPPIGRGDPQQSIFTDGWTEVSRALWPNLNGKSLVLA